MARRFSVLDSDSGDGDAHQGYSPEILPPSPRSSVRGNPCTSGALQRFLFEGEPLRDTINVTPPGLSSWNLSIGTSSEPPQHIRVSTNLQTQLIEILSEVRKTNTQVESYQKSESMEERLENLEKVQTPSSSEGSSETQKRKVPAHVRLC